MTRDVTAGRTLSFVQTSERNGEPNRTANRSPSGSTVFPKSACTVRECNKESLFYANMSLEIAAAAYIYINLASKKKKRR
jgi:hypothetical protein